MEENVKTKEMIIMFKLQLKNTQMSQGEKVNSMHLLMKDTFQVQCCLDLALYILLSF